MSRIIVPERRVWTRQPQRAAVLSPKFGFVAHPIGMGLWRLATKSGNRISSAGVWGNQVNQAGICSASGRAGGSGATFANFSIPDVYKNSVGEFTFFVYCDTNVYVSASKPTNVLSASLVAGIDFKLQVNPNSSGLFLISYTSRNSYSSVGSVSYTLGDSITPRVFAVRRKGTTLSLFCAGVEVATTPGTSDWGSARLKILGNIEDYAGVPHVYGVAGEPRALSDAEIASRSDNFWQIFAKRDRYAFVNLGGGSSVGLSIADGTHGHISDSLLLSWQDLLTVSDAAHSHSSDHVALSTDWLLSVGNSSHTHAADNLALSSAGATSLSVQDATHAHIVDGITLTTRWLLSIADGAHSHTADNLTLDTSNTTWLTVQDSAHGHASDNLALTLNTWLSIVDAAHAHYADAPTLTAETALQIAEVLHATYADTLVLSLPGAPGSYPSAESIAAAVVSALQGTTIPVDTKKMNGHTIIGGSSEADPWRGVGVQP